MKLLLKLILLLIFFCTQPVSAETERGTPIRLKPLSPSGEALTGNQWLFVIGIDSYLHWNPLKTAVNDAKAFKELMISRYYFDLEHVVELYDVQATRKNILAKFRYLAENVKAEDSLLIFYAGHGHIDDITKTGSWIPVESDRRDTSAWIPNQIIKNYLKIDVIKGKHILLISDSCFAGDFFRGQRGKLPAITEKYIREAHELPSRRAITSGGLEPVVDSGFNNHSVFSYFLLKLLEENRESFLISSQFFPDLKQFVVDNSRQAPEFGVLQNTGGTQGGEFVFFLQQQDMSALLEERKAEHEQIKKLIEEDKLARQRQQAEIARQEAELAVLDAEIEKLKKQLSSNVSTNGTLDAMLAVVQQKEKQTKILAELKKQQVLEEEKRRKEIERLQKKKDEKIIADLTPQVEKYKKIVASKYGKELEAAAWQELIKNLPSGWVKGVKEGDAGALLLSPEARAAVEAKLEQIKNRVKQNIKKAELEVKRSGFLGGIWHGLINIPRTFQSFPPHNPINTGTGYFSGYFIGLLVSCVLCVGVFVVVFKLILEESLSLITSSVSGNATILSTIFYGIWCCILLMLGIGIFHIG